MICAPVVLCLCFACAARAGQNQDFPLIGVRFQTFWVVFLIFGNLTYSALAADFQESAAWKWVWVRYIVFWV